MRDRGTLIAGAGIGLACLIAGAFYLVTTQREGNMRAREELQKAVDVQQAHALAMRRVEMDRAAAQSPENAIVAGANWLVQQQSPDGAWRSDLYAPFKSGTALTPQVVIALQAVDQPGMVPPGGPDPINAGCEWLAKLVKPNGTIEGAAGDLDFPVYTAALSVIALSHPDQKHHLKARDAWLKFLMSHQLTEQNGWKPGDKPYGGWGYCRLIPKKPEQGAFSPPLVESNISATLYALEAAKAAGVTDKDVYAKALAFLRQCQNVQPRLPGALIRTDGGFHFIYDDPVRNKAGVRDPDDKQFPFHSYGSATADGVRGYLICNASATGGVNWLKAHFRADSHPGSYIPAHEPNREAVYFYYAASVSKALRAAGVDRAGEVEWPLALAAELVKRQNPDGSWANPATLVREDEPLVATSHALIALANCTRK